jgi:hypothetical protein
MNNCPNTYYPPGGSCPAAGRLIGFDATGAPIYPGQTTISELAQEGSTYCVKVFQKLRYDPPCAANTAKYVDDCYAEFPKIAAIDTVCRGLGPDCDNWAWGQFSYPARREAYKEYRAVNTFLYPTQPARYTLGGR